MVTLSLEKREADRFCERERDAREADEEETNRRGGRRPLVSVGFFRFSFSSVFFIFPENHSNSSFYLHGTFLHPYRGALLFLPYSSNEEHCYCCALLRKSVLVRSLRARFANSFVRVASSLARFRETNWMDGAETFREREKKAILAAVSNFESDDRAIVPAKSARVQIRDDFLIHAFASRMICARFSSLHIRVVVPGGAREVNREKSKNISEREMRVEATAVRSFFA